MKRDVSLYLKDILSAMLSIRGFVEGMSFESFVNDDKTVSAVVCKLEVIGEAAKHVPDDFRSEYSEIPWKEMAGMRDRLIHMYFGIDYQLVWETITKRVVETMPLIEHVLETRRGIDA